MPGGWAFLCGVLLLVAMPRPAFTQTVLVELSQGAGRVEPAVRRALREAFTQEGVALLSAGDVARSWDDGLAPTVPPEAHTAWLEGVVTRTSAVDLFFANEFELAAQSLAPWLDLVETHPTLLALHPDLAGGAHDAALTLYRAYDALGDDALATETLQRTVRLFWFSPVDPARYPPSVLRAVELERGLTPTRTLEIHVRAGDSCEVRVNGARVEERVLSMPASPFFAQAVCSERASRVHRVPDSRGQLVVDVHLDDAVRRHDDGLELAPRALARPAWGSLLGALGEVIGADAVAAVSWVDGEVGGRQLEMVWVERQSASLRVARVAGVDNARLREAIRFLVRGEDSSGLVTWTEAGAWDGLPTERRRVAVPVLTGVTAASLVAAGASQALRGQAARAVDACADDLAGCGLGDTITARRDTLRRRHRAAVTTWSVAGVSAVALTAAALSGAGRRDVQLDLRASARSAVASARILF